MKMNRNIKSLAELNKEVRQLKTEIIVKETLLKRDAKTYVNSFSPINLFKGLVTSKNVVKAEHSANISGKIMSYVLPFILNKTMFRGSGFFTKSIATLVSRRLGKSIDIDNVTGIINQITSFFNSKKEKKDVRFKDYGIPPDSETY